MPNFKNNKWILASIGFFMCCSVAVVSCKRDELPKDTDISGTWTGVSTCDTGTVSVQITKGGTNAVAVISGKVGLDNCTSTISIAAAISGNSITIPVQTFTDPCAVSYTVSGTGSVNENEITITLYTAGVLTSFQSTCIFAGRK